MTRKLESFIEHTLLKPDAKIEDIKKICSEAIKYKFRAVCISPSFVSVAKEILKDTDVLVVTVVGFPFGTNQTSTKAYETKEAILAGADEIDMVMNFGALKEKKYLQVFEDIKAVVNEAKPSVVKVIIETCYLTREEKIIASIICSIAGARYVKTSTGYGKNGATAADIELIRSVIPGDMKIKASGGIKTYEEAQLLIDAGADSLGTSSSIKILKKE